MHILRILSVSVCKMRKVHELSALSKFYLLSSDPLVGCVYRLLWENARFLVFVGIAVELSGFGEKTKSLPLGLKTPLDRTVNDGAVDLSGGEKQRLLLARLIYKDPLCMILDEPTASLDPIAEAQVYEKFNRIARGRTSVFISHRLSSCRFCGRMLVLDKGKITQDGGHEEPVKQEGKYRKMRQAQAGWYVGERSCEYLMGL